MYVRSLAVSDLDDVAQRVQRRLNDDAARNNLVNAHFDLPTFVDALRQSLDRTWVAIANEHVVGHLYGAVLDSVHHGRGAWLGPDGVSFDSPDVLAALYDAAATSWSRQNAFEHFVWVFDSPTTTLPWTNLGFERAHVRGALALAERPERGLEAQYVIRQGGSNDLVLALELDAVIDAAEGRSSEISNSSAIDIRREELEEELADPDVQYYVLEEAGRGVAQCSTYLLEPRRGSFERDDARHLARRSPQPSTPRTRERSP